MDQENKGGGNTTRTWSSPRDILCTVLAVVLGMVAGWLDLQVTEVIVTIVALMTSGLLLGLIQPKAAWRWSLLITVGLPVMELVAMKFNLRTTEPVHFDLLVTLVALVFAMMGTYAGVFLRYVIRT